MRLSHSLRCVIHSSNILLFLEYLLVEFSPYYLWLESAFQIFSNLRQFFGCTLSFLRRGPYIASLSSQEISC